MHYVKYEVILCTGKLLGSRVYIPFHCDVPQPLKLLDQGNKDCLSDQRTDQ